MNRMKDIVPLNAERLRHGYHEHYWAATGNLWYKSHMVNGKLVGYEEDHWIHLSKTYYLK